jgi:uncharacterized protein (DUF302 family)
MLYERETTATVAEVCAKLTEAAADNKFGVLGMHDLKQKMAEKGVNFGPQCRILEVCNPHQAKVVLEANPRISTALPCRIAVYEHHGKTVVSTLKPTELLSLFGDPDLHPTAQGVESAIIRMIDAACGAC